MSQQITKIKSRIKTVSSALKVTSAMKLVSTVKLNRYKNKMLANRSYSSKISEITDGFNAAFDFSNLLRHVIYSLLISKKSSIAFTNPF